MKPIIFCFSVLCLFSFTLTGQNNTDYQPPTNVRCSSGHLPYQVDVMWTPPEGWAPSPVDRWIDWDKGIWDGNSLGSCMDCPAVNSLASGYPLPMGPSPAMIGYGNLLNWGAGWDTLTSINPDIDFNWSIGGFLETPNDTIKYPLFNVYRSIDGQPYQKIHEGNFLDTIYYDFLGYDLDPSHLYYYVTCVYEDGESEPSDTLHFSFVNTPEVVQNNNIKLFPNPASDKVMIESGNGRITSLSLINNKGDVILERSFGSERAELDLTAIASSFYFLRVITEYGVFTSKLLIVK